MTTPDEQNPPRGLAPATPLAAGTPSSDDMFEIAPGGQLLCRYTVLTGEHLYFARVIAPQLVAEIRRLREDEARLRSDLVLAEAALLLYRQRDGAPP